MKRRNVLTAACAWALLPAAGAQELPKKTLTIVVGFAAGGAADHAARVVAKRLSENLGGQTVVIDNKAGAGGNIAHQLVANAESDGSTILLGSIGPLAIAPHMMKVGYDPFKDLAPLTMGMNFPNVLVVPPSLGVKTLGELIALAKREPGKLNYGSTGAGSASHLAGELFNGRAGIDIVHVPYKGGAPAVVELLAGRLSVYFATMSTAGPHIASGKLVALATTGLTRAPFLPNLPTVAETLPGFSATNWYAFVAPGKTPAPVLERWNQELVKALKSPEVSDELTRSGLLPAPGTRDELARYIETESKTWAKVIVDRKVTAN